MKQIKLPEKVQNILSTLQNNGYEAYLVGGCVRDLIMKRPVNDWDFTTNATPEKIQIIFPNSFYTNEFGTVGVKVKEKNNTTVYEITTYRKEKSYKDRRHPKTVTWTSSLQKDLSRRDFTINAIAFDGEKIIDPFMGRSDIKKKIIRCVGDPCMRFQEDALRMMRAVRIASQLGFNIEEQTKKAIVKNAALIKQISYERIRDEFFKILESKYPADGVLLLKNLSLLYHFLPEFEKAFLTEQKSPQRHHTLDVGTHLVETLRHVRTKDAIVRFAALLHDIGKPDTADINKEGVRTFYNHEIAGASIAYHIAQRLRLSKMQREKLVRLVRWHQFSVNENQTDASLRRFIKRVGKDYIHDMLELRRADRLGGGAKETSWRTELFKKRLIKVQKQPFTVRDLAISGNDVMKTLHISQGPKVGEVLQTLYQEVIDKKIPNTKKALLSRLQSLVQ